MPFQQICQVGTMLSVGVGIARSHHKFGPTAPTSQLLVVVHRRHLRRQHQSRRHPPRPLLHHRPLLRIVATWRNPAKWSAVMKGQSNQIARLRVAAGSQRESTARLLGATIHQTPISMCDCARLQASGLVGRGYLITDECSECDGRVSDASWCLTFFLQAV